MAGLQHLGGTLILRPYVFVFLIAFVILAQLTWGWRRTALYAGLGYALAWAAEYSSTHNGFPFGPYSYISGPTLDNELWVAGVPFMDSLSFVFLTFAGLQTARLALSPVVRGPRGWWDVRWADPAEGVGWRTWLLAGVLTMGLDVIIDPVALHGDQWFLGLIYNYPNGGAYFGVPLSNFGGWAFLAWCIIGSFLVLDRAVLKPRWGVWKSYPADAVWGLGLFVGVLAFNLTATFAIGQTTLGLVGCLWSVLMMAPIAARLLRFRALSRREWA